MADRKALNHELSKLFNEMWDMDVNRFAPGKDYAIELQGKADAVQQGDSAARHLFHYVNEERLKNTKTFATFISLLDNYETSTGVEEVVTPEEIAENNCFLDAILMTGVMKLAHQYLVKKKLAKPKLVDFKYQLYDIWFQLYPRKEGDRPDSCGFEHVFVGETRHGKQILGLHNWVQFYLQEKHKQIDYKGYIARKNKTRVRTSRLALKIRLVDAQRKSVLMNQSTMMQTVLHFSLYTSSHSHSHCGSHPFPSHPLPTVICSYCTCSRCLHFWTPSRYLCAKRLGAQLFRQNKVHWFKLLSIYCPQRCKVTLVGKGRAVQKL
uniref:Uridylate-specific endoribonuclease n=1 Tax=Phasianus colchicus TaxID=9054 RepID=A0A669PRW9_PHACC